MHLRYRKTDHPVWALTAARLHQITPTATPGRISIVVGPTSPGQMTLFLALIAAGRLAAIFPPSNSIQDQQAYLAQQRESLRKIDPEHIYVFDEHMPAMLAEIDPALARRVVTLQPEIDPLEHEAQSAKDRFLARLADPGPIFVQHSSGTTGIKKAVAITGAKLAAQYAAYWPGIRAAAGGSPVRIASWLPLYHDMGLLTALLLPAIGGDSVSIIDPFEWIGNPGLLFDIIEEDECQIAWMPNFGFRHLVRLSGNLKARRLDTMKAWIDCSEPCRLADAIGFETAFASWGVAPGTVVGCYAMAETVFAATHCAPGARKALAISENILPGADVRQAGATLVDDLSLPAAKHVLSSGQALDGLTVVVLADGQPAPEGIYGEFAIKGACVFDGYAALSRAESNLDHTGFRTGDLGTIIDGHVFVFGRLKEILIVNGKNLFAGDLEAAVGRIAGVKPGRAVALGLESAQTGSEELIVIAEYDPNAGRDTQSVRAEISRTIGQSFLVVPRDVRVVEDRWLVKSTSGKVSRSENLQKYLHTFRQNSRA